MKKEWGNFVSDYIFGKNSVLEAIKAGREINRLIIADNLDKRFVSEIIESAKNNSIPYVFQSKKQMEKFSEKNHQGLIAEVAAASYVEVEDILADAAKKEEDPLIVILSEVEDPHNLGAIIRTAYCAGAHGVVIPKRRSASLNQTVAKVSAGAAEYLPVARVSNLVQTVEKLKKEGLWLIAADMKGENLWQIDFKGPIAIVLGSEGHGIAPLLLEKCDYIAKIPIKGKISSLNVSAAAAVFLYEAMKTRL